MSNIILKSLSIRNFKGCKSSDISFGDATTISGQNASGKTSILDAFLWLLFNKDSQGATSFGIRPVGSDGKEIDNIEISVEAVLDVDGKETILKKVQKQKWTKKRGSASPTYEGNVNSYELNGFPQSEKEYKAKVAEILPEETFRLIADLRYFSGLKWQEKKALLLKLCGDVTDEDVLNSDPTRWKIISEDVLNAGVEKSTEKAKRELRDLNKLQKELPVRIDEVSKQVREVPDAESLREQEANLDAELSELSSKMDALKADSSEAELRKRQLEIQNEINAKILEESAKRRSEKDRLYGIYSEKKTAFADIDRKRARCQGEVDIYTNKIAVLRESLNSEGQAYKAAAGREFDESQTVCKSCGQMLPKSEIARIKSAFENLKKQDLDTHKAKGWEIKNSITSIEQDLEKTKISLALLEEESEKAKAEMRSANEVYEAYGPDWDINADEKMIALHQELEAVVEKISASKEVSWKIDEMNLQINGTKGKLNAVRQQIAEIDAIKTTNADIADRIEELEEEQRTVGQKIAYTEQKFITLEEFSIQKSELLSKKITSCFAVTNFSLFNQQINGGVTEECEISLNGVKYRDMNSGHRIVCAMDIIKTFSQKLGVTAPLFIDNAESVNDFNLPKMDCQLILLKVTDDPKLVVSP